MKHKILKKTLSFWSPVLFIDAPDSSIFHFIVYIRSGFMFVEKSQFEIPHILEHCLFEKNKHFKSSIDFKSKIESLWAYYNWYTNSGLNYFTISWPQNKKNTLIKLLLDLIFDASITEDIFNQQKIVIKNELQKYENDFNKNIWNNIDCTIANWKLPYSERIKNLDSIEYKDTIKYYKDFYVPKNMDFVFAWNIGKENKNIIKNMESYFLDKQKWTRRQFDIKIWDEYKQKILSLDIKEKSNITFNLRFIFKKASFLEYKNILFFLYIVWKWMWARVNYKSRELWYSYSTQFSVWLLNWYLEFSISDSVDEWKLLPLIQLIRNEINDIKKWNISKEEIKRATWYMYWLFLKWFRNEEDLIGYYAQRFSMWIEVENLNTFIGSIKKFSKQDVMEIWEKIFKKDNWIISVIWKDTKKYNKKLLDLLTE